jgi:hypothetical protein
MVCKSEVREETGERGREIEEEGGRGASPVCC